MVVPMILELDRESQVLLRETSELDRDPQMLFRDFPELDREVIMLLREIRSKFEIALCVLENPDFHFLSSYYAVDSTYHTHQQSIIGIW